jgi:hypothetical protein
MALTKKQLKVAKDMFFYIIATEKLDDVNWEFLNKSEEKQEDFNELKEYIEQEIERPVSEIFKIPSNVTNMIDYVRQNV